MQIVDIHTPMRTFSIVLLTITLATILTVFILTSGFQRAWKEGGRKTRRAICRYSPVIEKRLNEVLPEHSCKLRKERFQKALDQIKAGAEHSFWAYICLLGELCFVAIPVSEVNRVVRIFHKQNQQPTSTYQKTRQPSQTPPINSGQTFSGGRPSQEGSEQKTLEQKTLAQKILEAVGVRESRKSRLRVGLSNGSNILLTVLRSFLLLLWVPMLLLEYISLLIYQVWADSRRRNRKRKTLRQFFITPLLSLGIYFSKEYLQKLGMINTGKSQSFSSVFGGVERSQLSPSFPSSQTPGDETLLSNTMTTPHGAQQWKHIVSQQTFREYQNHNTSDWSLPASPQTLETPPPTLQLNRQDYPDVESGFGDLRRH
jgi:hypothetical protein